MAGLVAGRGSNQSIGFYDLTGRLLHTLPVGTDTAGVAHWDGRDQSGHRVPAGLYFARLVSGSQHATTRIVLLP